MIKIPGQSRHLTKKFHSHELESGSLILVHDHFDTIKKHIERLNLTGKVNAICADIGVSSPQIDEADRGFSFYP